MIADKNKQRQLITIRFASLSDAAVIAAVHIASWRETYAGLLPDQTLRDLSVTERTQLWFRILKDAATSPDTAVLVAEREGHVVGFASGGRQRDQCMLDQGFTGEITAIYVVGTAQRLGIGQQLMRRLACALMDGGHTSASLWVLRDNRPARGFYDRLGGSVVAEKEDRDDSTTLYEVAYAWHNLATLANHPAPSSST